MSLDDRLTRLLLLINDAGEPVGSRHLVAGLAKLGTVHSEATVARRLRQLDDRGLTVKVGTKGRRLSDAGRALARAVKAGAISAERLHNASDIRTTWDLLNLLRARRGIEPEAVRDATSSLCGTSGASLRDLVDRHRIEAAVDGSVPRDTALAFHREIAQHTRNPLVRAMLDIALNENMDFVEATLDVILEAHHRNAESVHEHADIAEAMLRGDAEHAAQLMHHHLTRLIHEVDEFVAAHDDKLIDRLLERAAPDKATAAAGRD